MKRRLHNVSFLKHPRKWDELFSAYELRIDAGPENFSFIPGFVVHAFLPFLFETHTSRTISQLNTIFEDRKLKNISNGDIDRKKTRHPRILTKA